MSYSKLGKFFALAALLGAPAFAQEFKFDVPFAFTTGSQTWDAGNYTVSLSTGVLNIRNTLTHKGSFLMTTATDSHAKADGLAVLKFNQYGDRYFLSQLWVGLDRGAALRKSQAEKEQSKGVGPVLATVKASGR
jgi:hypothetical protein